MKTAVLFATHIWNDFVFDQYNALKSCINDIGDLYVLLHKEYNSDILLPADVICYSFDMNSLKELNYFPISDRVYENNHFSLFQFYRDNPYYTYYWYIEYDVFFRGDWDYFFYSMGNIECDFISSHIESYNERPCWNWWKSLILKDLQDPSIELIKSFNPIYRISSSALHFLNEKLKVGNSGHHEVLIPTLLNNSGFKMGDLGNRGAYRLPELKEPFYLTGLSNFRLNNDYSESTMRFRPQFDRNKIESYKIVNMLFHPVKQ